MKSRKTLATALPIVLCFALFLSCKKNNDSNTQLNIRLTDAPYNAQEVNVDIREVRVNFAADSTGWVPLQTNAKVYNLLGLQNGVDTLLASASVPAGTVQELRFILGSNNSIKINNVTYPLSVASADESGLKIKVGKKLNKGLDNLLIDFDAELSVIQTGNGTYKLKPVLKLK
jgi:hypothetical protein